MGPLFSDERFRHQNELKLLKLFIERLRFRGGGSEISDISRHISDLEGVGVWQNKRLFFKNVNFANKNLKKIRKYNKTVLEPGMNLAETFSSKAGNRALPHESSL